MGPYKALRTWVDEFIPYYMGNNVSLDPGAYIICANDVRIHQAGKIP